MKLTKIWIPQPQDVFVCGGRSNSQRAMLKFAR